MSIERNFLKPITRLLAALACVVALSACVSPDLEPPGAADTTLPGTPGATERARAEDRTAKSQVPAADAGTTVAPTAGQAAKPAMEAMTAPRQATTPPSAAGSGAPGVPGDTHGDEDADAGTKTP